MTLELADWLWAKLFLAFIGCWRRSLSLCNLTVRSLCVTLSSNARTACHSISHILTTNALPWTLPKALKIYTLPVQPSIFRKSLKGLKSFRSSLPQCLSVVIIL